MPCYDCFDQGPNIQNGDFSKIVKLLQNYPNFERRVLINKAAESSNKNKWKKPNGL